MVWKNNTSNPYANQISRDPYANRQYNPGAHTHTINPALPVHTSPVAPAKGDQYSIAEVQLVSGGMIGMTINASIKVADHLLKTMKETGFLHLRNEAEAIVLRAEDVRAFKLTQLTTEG